MEILINDQDTQGSVCIRVLSSLRPLSRKICCQAARKRRLADPALGRPDHQDRDAVAFQVAIVGRPLDGLLEPEARSFGPKAVFQLFPIYRTKRILGIMQRSKRTVSAAEKEVDDAGENRREYSSHDLRNQRVP